MDKIAIIIGITEFLKKLLSKIRVYPKGFFSWILSAVVSLFVMLYYHIDNFDLSTFIIDFIQNLILANSGYIALNNIFSKEG